MIVARESMTWFHFSTLAHSALIATRLLTATIAAKAGRLPSRCAGMDVQQLFPLLPQNSCRKTAASTLPSMANLALLIVTATTHLWILPTSMLLVAWCTTPSRFHMESISSTYASYQPSLQLSAVKLIETFWPLISPRPSPRFLV